MSDMDQFFTDDKASEGKKIPLVTPSGEKTEHWLKVRSIDSEEYRLAKSASMRVAIGLNESNESESAKRKKRDKAVLSMIASLIAGWSFEKECTTKNVIELLRKAPQIREEVEAFASNRKEYYAKKPEACTSSPEHNSGSTKSQTDQASH